MPTIRSSSDLQRNIGEVYALCHETKAPVYITRNGKTDLVVMDAETYEEQCDLQKMIYEREMDLYRNIMTSQDDYKQGKVTSFSDIRRDEV